MADDTMTVTDVFPWAAPTVEQIAEFEALTPEEQLALVREAVRKGFASGMSEHTAEEILAQARSRMRAEENG